MITVRQFLEKMGRIAFFRSGNEPIVLNEQQREARKTGIFSITLVDFNYNLINIYNSLHAIVS